jgi:mRNA interferase MazF
VAGFVKGDIVVVPFPFSDLTGSKRRPAMVLKNLPGDDIILCQITSRQHTDSYSVEITNADFTAGSLPVASNIRPARIFTADKNIIVRKAGTLSPIITKKVISTLIALFS